MKNSNIESLLKIKTTMDHLMVCIKDQSVSAADKKEFYADYLQLSANYLIMMRD